MSRRRRRARGAQAACAAQQLTLLFTLDAQGPTSSGKTSLVEYLARRTGHTCAARHPSLSSLGSALGQLTTAAMTCQMFF